MAGFFVCRWWELSRHQSIPVVQQVDYGTRSSVRDKNPQDLRHTILSSAKGGQACLTLCPKRDSNSHGLRHTILSRACIPISPLGLVSVGLFKA